MAGLAAAVAVGALSALAFGDEGVFLALPADVDFPSPSGDGARRSGMNNRPPGGRVKVMEPGREGDPAVGRGALFGVGFAENLREPWRWVISLPPQITPVSACCLLGCISIKDKVHVSTPSNNSPLRGFLVQLF